MTTFLKMKTSMKTMIIKWDSDRLEMTELNNS
jgi:hypothetical protein